MAGGDKIRVNWDDLDRPEIAAQVERERQLRAAAMHYRKVQQTTSEAAPGSEGRVYGAIQGGLAAKGRTGGAAMRFFYQPAVHAGLAGLLMAFLAWAVTEPIPYFSGAADVGEELARYLESRGYTLLSLSQESMATQEWVLEEFKQKIRTGIYTETMLWFGIIGAAIGAGLCASEYLVGRAYQKARSAALVGLAIGFMGGGIAGGLAQYLYASLTSLNEEQSLGLQILARSAGWGLAGMLLGTGQGIAMRSGKKIRNGLIGGLLGGLVGGALFDPIANSVHSAWASRMLALCVIGAATGVLIGFVESVLKDAWLVVTGGPLTGKQFVIYRNPTILGSAPKADIYLFKDPAVEPRHAALHMAAGFCELEDLGTPAGTLVNGQRIGRHRLRSGDAIGIGHYSFAYSERARTGVGVAAGN